MPKTVPSRLRLAGGIVEQKPAKVIMKDNAPLLSAAVYAAWLITER